MTDRTPNSFDKEEYAKRVILRIIRDNPYIQPSKIVEHIEEKEKKIASEPTIYKYLEELKDEGKITSEQRPGNDKNWYYYITDKYIEGIGTQADLLFLLIETCTQGYGFEEEKKDMYKELKDKSIGQLWLIVENQTINEEEFKKIIVARRDIMDRLKRHLEVFKQKDGIDISEENITYKIGLWKRECMFQPFYGPLIQPKIQYMYKKIVRHLLDRMEKCNKKGDKEILSETAKMFLENMVSPYKPIKPKKHTEQTIIKFIDNLLDIEPLERYEFFNEFVIEEEYRKSGPKDIDNLKSFYDRYIRP